MVDQSYSRRRVCATIIALVGGGAAIASCGDAVDLQPTPPGLNNLQFFTPEEFKLLTRVADFIIPRTETPSASDVNVVEYIDALMVNWANADTRERTRSTLNRMTERLGHDFATLNEETALSRLSDLDAAAFEPSTADEAYQELKSLVETTYRLSPEAAYEEYRYEPVPGDWNPKILVSERFG